MDGAGEKSFLHERHRQFGAGLAVSAGAWVNLAACVSGEKRLNLTNDLATGSVALKHLPNPAPERAVEAADAIARVIFCRGLL